MSSPTPTSTATEALEPAAYARLLAATVVLGLPLTLMCAGYLQLVHVAEHWLWVEIPDKFGVDGYHTWWWAPLLLMIGAVAVIAARRVPGSAGGPPLDGLHFPVEPRDVATVVAVAFASLSFGAVLGPELPLIALGSAAGLFVARKRGLSDDATQVVALAATFAAISTVFGHPLAAAIVLLELVGPRLGAKTVSLLLPGLLAAGSGYLIFSGLGNWAGVPKHTLTIAGLPSYPDARVTDLIAAAVLGILVGLLGLAVHSVGKQWLAIGDRIGTTAHTCATAAVLAALAAVFLLATGDDVSLVLFSGQSALNELATAPATWVLALAVVFKSIAFGLCMGGQYRGGTVFPIVFIGAAIGTTFVDILPDALSVTAMASAGVAAGMTAILKLPISGLMFALVCVGDVGLASTTAAIFGAAGAYLVHVAADYRSALKSTDLSDEDSR